MHQCLILHWEGLKHALLVGAYLSLVTFPSILSAPASRTMAASSRERRPEPKWVNPCGVNGGDQQQQQTDAQQQQHRVPDHRLLDNVVNQARIAQNQAAQLGEDYVHKTFNTNFESHHALFAEKDYDWLPTKNIPKKLNEAVPEEHLQSLELETALTDVYTYLQQIGVGLEQVTWDEEDRQGPFQAPFAQTEDFLRNLLCEIQTAILEKDIRMPENVTREVMEEEFRHMDNTSMNIRNWIIYRDYLNMLDYIIQVFKYFREKLPAMG